MGVFWNNLRKMQVISLKAMLGLGVGLNSFSQNNTNKFKDGVWLWGFVCRIKKHAIAQK